MSDIQITLQLERRSGILAGAVASLHRNGLQFRSQRMRDSGNGGSYLVLEAEGELTETEPLVDALCGSRGIAKVTELLVDGEIVLDNSRRSSDKAPAPKPSPQPADDAKASPPPAVEKLSNAAPRTGPGPVPESGGHVTLVDLSDDDEELFPPPDPDPRADETVQQAAAEIPGDEEPVREKRAVPSSNPLPAAAARRRRYNR